MIRLLALEFAGTAKGKLEKCVMTGLKMALVVKLIVQVHFQDTHVQEEHSSLQMFVKKYAEMESSLLQNNVKIMTGDRLPETDVRIFANLSLDGSVKI